MAPTSRILIVDDDVDLAKILAATLEGRVAAMDLAHDYAEADRMLEGEPRYDIAFIDVMLGKAPRGTELARKAAARGVQVAAMTGLAKLPDDLHGAALLTKPFSAETVRMVLESLRR
jgi:DNA-binding response OmpR family regulator